MRTHIKVTKEDIASGFRRSAVTCPVAYAVRRHLNLPQNTVVIGVTVATIDGVNNIKLPKSVSKFITSFDLDRNSVKPFGFYLNH